MHTGTQYINELILANVLAWLVYCPGSNVNSPIQHHNTRCDPKMRVIKKVQKPRNNLLGQVRMTFSMAACPDHLYCSLVPNSSIHNNSQNYYEELNSPLRSISPLSYQAVNMGVYGDWLKWLLSWNCSFWQFSAAFIHEWIHEVSRGFSRGVFIWRVCSF